MGRNTRKIIIFFHRRSFHHKKNCRPPLIGKGLSFFVDTSGFINFIFIDLPLSIQCSLLLPHFIFSPWARSPKVGHRYQKGALNMLNWTLIFLYIMYLSTYLPYIPRRVREVQFQNVLSRTPESTPHAIDYTGISASFWYRKVVWLRDYFLYERCQGTKANWMLCRLIKPQNIPERSSNP